MNLTYRLIETPADWDEAARLRNAYAPMEPLLGSQMREANEALPPEADPLRRLVILNGEAVAFASLVRAFWTPRPELFESRLLYVPGSVSGEFALTVLREMAERAKERGAAALGIWIDSEDAALGYAVAEFGFEHMQRNPRSRLDLQTFDPSQWSTELPAGYEIRTLAELREEVEDWEHRIWRLEMDIMRDVPLPEPFAEIPFAVFRREHEREGFHPETVFIALHGKEWVGMSGLTPSLADRTIYSTGLTGTLRDHRGRSLATAMKVLGLTWAKAHGGLLVGTDNEESNPMFQINLKLGFYRTSDWVSYQVVL